MRPNGGSTFWNFCPCRTDELDALNKLKERTSAWRDNSIVLVKQLLKNIGDKIFAPAEDRFINLLTN